MSLEVYVFSEILNEIIPSLKGASGMFMRILEIFNTI